MSHRDLIQLPSARHHDLDILTDTDASMSEHNDHDDQESMADLSNHTVQTVLPNVNEDEILGYRYADPQYYQPSAISSTTTMTTITKTPITSQESGTGHNRSMTAVVISPITPSVTEESGIKLPIPGAHDLTRSPSNVLNSDAYRDAVARFRKCINIIIIITII
ncbi:hypothetical protein BDF19DRAFT_282530 [Syncephalis fuscata]|nr:hypothetical protein BDF19DRAFT_282530 [Syncephalis fuscata]